MNIRKYEVGDTVKIVSSRYDFQWYHTNIGKEYKVCRTDTLPLDYLLVEVDGESRGVFLRDIVLVQKGEQMKRETTSLLTEDAVLHLQSLLDMCLDENVSIIIKPTEMNVKAFGKEYAVANAEELENVCKAVSYLSGMEIV